MDANAQILIYAVVVSMLLSAVAAVYCFVQSRRHSAALEACLEENAEIKNMLETCRTQVAEISLKNEDLSRLTAWLETRVRERKPISEKTDAEPASAAVTEPLKSTITERRHRVLSLAERGQNPESIAATLGMLSGEVELILNLNRAAA